MPLYHLIGVDAFRACADPAAYRPATYEQDGFIHLTEDANSLLGIANHFYKTVPGDFIVLELDPAQLAGEVRFEAAAPVGNIAPSASIDAALFPTCTGTLRPRRSWVNCPSVGRKRARFCPSSTRCLPS